MAQLSISAFVTKYTALFADNITGEISEGDLRGFMQDIADSFSNLISTPTPSANYSTIAGDASTSVSLVTYITTQISNLKAGVSTNGDTLAKLYALIVALGSGTASNSFYVGDATNTGNKEFVAQTAATNKPKIRYNTTSSKWEFTNNGTSWTEFSSAVWGAISGTLSSQTDLQTALDAKASISYVDSEIDAAVVGLYDDRGNYDASVNTFPASGGSGSAGAILKGDIWTISVAGTLGGTAVIAGQTVRAKQDTPGQTAGNWAISVGSTEINNASETVSGKVEKATQTEVNAGTGTGGTGAPLFVNPVELKVITDQKANLSGASDIYINGFGSTQIGILTTGDISTEDNSGNTTVYSPDEISVKRGGFETNLVTEDPTANRTITFPDASGEVILDNDPAINIFLFQNFI